MWEEPPAPGKVTEDPLEAGFETRGPGLNTLILPPSTHHDWRFDSYA